MTSELADAVKCALAAAYREVAEWADPKESEALLKMASAVEALDEHAACCPVCEETTCDDSCPLAQVRSRWQEPACAGKDFEHHERGEVGGELGDRWRCPDCGGTGSFEATFAKFLALLPQLERLQEHMLDREAVFLLPSDATPGLFGQCFGRDVYRMRGLRGPMIALGAGQLDIEGSRMIAAGLVFDVGRDLLPPSAIRVTVRSACDRKPSEPA